MTPQAPRILCQPDGKKSCGACCGMYNDPGASDREATLERLALRTRAFRQKLDPSDTDALQRFRRDHEPGPTDKLLPDLPSCPFLGLLDHHRPQDDPATSRVGCLLHPSLHDGRDARDCGVYDRHTCEDYLCAAHALLKAHERLLIVRSIQDSYLYGLVVSDVRFVRELLTAAARLNGMSPPVPMLDAPRAHAAAGDYFRLKIDWPFADVDGVFGQLQAGQGLDTPRRPGPSAALGLQPDHTEAALRCLGTRVDSTEDLACARAAVQERFEAFARAVAI